MLCKKNISTIFVGFRFVFFGHGFLFVASELHLLNMGISFKVFIYYVLCVWITMIAGANISIAHKTKLYIEKSQILKKKSKIIAK
jgi:hypothetical protein